MTKPSPAPATQTTKPPAPPTRKPSAKKKKKKKSQPQPPAPPPASSSRQPSDAQLTATILALTSRRFPPKTICPSEVPRALCSAWRDCMPRVRRLAIQLAQEGRIEITQGGQVVHVEKEEEIKGPIRLRWKEAKPKEE